MTGGERDYLAYLLRLWRTGTGKSARWHGSLQDARTGQQVGFACLDDLVVYLREKMGEGGAGVGDGADGACVHQRPS